VSSRRFVEEASPPLDARLGDIALSTLCRGNSRYDRSSSRTLRLSISPVVTGIRRRASQLARAASGRKSRAEASEASLAPEAGEVEVPAREAAEDAPASPEPSMEDAFPAPPEDFESPELAAFPPKPPPSPDG